jgi:hypothetical protein
MIVPSTLQLEEIMQDKQRVLILTVLANLASQGLLPALVLKDPGLRGCVLACVCTI